MNRLLRFIAYLTTVMCLAAANGSAWAQQAAGRFLSVTGEVSVVGRDGARRAAAQGAEIQSGETVVTGDNALAQMRMADSSLISVRSASEFKLEEFAFAGKDDRNGSFVVSVLKGGFRTITGLVAQTNRRNYRITTPSATIGVRGTHFEVVHVQTPGANAPAGTYNRVYDGITSLQNPAGVTLLVNREQTAFASLQPGVAPVLVAPPAVIFGRPTPVPRAAAPQQQPQQAGTPGTRPGAATVREGTVPTIREGSLPTRTLQPTPALTPLEPTTVRSPTLAPAPLQPVPTLTPIEPRPILAPAPLDPVRTITPTPALNPIAPPVIAPTAPPPVIQPATVPTAPLQPAPTIKPNTVAPLAPVLTRP